MAIVDQLDYGSFSSILWLYILDELDNYPRRACAERVTVVVLCVCMSVTHTLFWQYARLKV